MALIDVYNAANDETFQGKCVAAVWQVAQHVLAGDPGYDSSNQSRNYALRVIRGQTVATGLQYAVQVLRNAVIASSPSAATDSDIIYQVNQVWADLQDVG